MKNGSFLIENATKRNEGKFLCQVTNGIGGTKTFSFIKYTIRCFAIHLIVP